MFQIINCFYLQDLRASCSFAVLSNDVVVILNFIYATTNGSDNRTDRLISTCLFWVYSDIMSHSNTIIAYN